MHISTRIQSISVQIKSADKGKCNNGISVLHNKIYWMLSVGASVPLLAQARPIKWNPEEMRPSESKPGIKWRWQFDQLHFILTLAVFGKLLQHHSYFQSPDVQIDYERRGWTKGRTEEENGGRVNKVLPSSWARVTLQFQVRKYFRLADKDGDGQITKAEWFKVLNDAGVPTTMWVHTNIGPDGLRAPPVVQSF